MKRSHFYLLATAIGLLILLALFALYTNTTDNSPATINAPAGATTSPAATPLSTTTAAGTFLIDPAIPIAERCTPVTLACLEAQPEWGPTMATTGIKRVKPGELTLFNNRYELERFPVPKGRQPELSPFEMVVRAADFKEEYCAQYDDPDLRPGQRCNILPYTAYTEMAIVLKGTEKVVHAYRTTDEYSLLYPYWLVMGGRGILLAA